MALKQLFLPVFLAASLGLFGPAASAAQGSSQVELRQVLRQLEERGRGFRNFSARFTQKKYCPLITQMVVRNAKPLIVPLTGIRPRPPSACTTSTGTFTPAMFGNLGSPLPMSLMSNLTLAISPPVLRLDAR